MKDTESIVVIDDVSLLVPFHNLSHIYKLIKQIKLQQIIVVCTDSILFKALQPLFTQAITENDLRFTVFTTKTKKSHSIEKHPAAEPVRLIEEIKELRDVSSAKQQESKDNLKLPFEKVQRFGDDSDVSDFSDDDDLDV